MASKGGFVIDIHDAFLVNPEDAHTVRSEYCRLMEEIRDNRKEILSNYFQSIGVNATAKEQWEALMAKTTPLPEDFKCFDMALK